MGARLTLAALLVAATGCSTGTQSAASCVGPHLPVLPSAAKAGETVHVSGEWFAANCADTVVDGQRAKTIPLTGLEVDVLQNQRTWTLAKDVNASGGHVAFDAAVVLPADLLPGPAVIQVPGHGARVVVTVVGWARR
jgi:ABC-type glycerol-3-phosphate transport system substrate-binding protein